MLKMFLRVCIISESVIRSHKHDEVRRGTSEALLTVTDYLENVPAATTIPAMSTILLKSVCKCMERIAPLRLAEKWDNVSSGLDVLENQLTSASRSAFCWVRQATSAP